MQRFKAQLAVLVTLRMLERVTVFNYAYFFTNIARSKYFNKLVR